MSAVLSNLPRHLCRLYSVKRRLRRPHRTSPSMPLRIAANVCVCVSSRLHELFHQRKMKRTAGGWTGGSDGGSDTSIGG